MTLIVSPKKLTWLLTTIVILLVIGHVLGRLDLNGENNLSSWYASSTLLLCAGFLSVIGLAKRRDHDRYAAHWLALSIIFLCLSLDEAASIHEMAIWPIRQHMPRYTTGYLYFAWVIPGALFVFIILLNYFRFLLDLPSGTRQQFLLAGAAYVGGAWGIELLEGKYASLHGIQHPIMSTLIAVEESLEMLGVVVFLYALSSYIASHVGEVRLVITPTLPVNDPLSSERAVGPVTPTVPHRAPSPVHPTVKIPPAV